MKIDFDKLGTSNIVDTASNPREIFNALPKHDETKFQYPRDVQSQVWSKWYERRTSKDLVIKMNTGSGKTIIGLLILKSCINEGIAPAVYIAPDNYLVEQVKNEAKSLGLDVTDDPSSARFLRGKSILVVNIHRLINGRSIFGVGDEGSKISIGSIVLDDVHACLNTTEDQFTININYSCQAYKDIFDLFKEALFAQSETKAIELENFEYNANMLVPFWEWQSKISALTNILIKHKEHDDIKFSWPLIKEHLHLCRCVIGGGALEISPHCLPVNVIPSFIDAKRRIFMTATLTDDSVLSSHFDLSEESITKVIVPDSAGDIGDRMIIVPQELNSEITDEDLKSYFKLLSKNKNVVIIVPSDYRLNFWRDIADLILKKENLYSGVERLKTEHVGLVILLNRYDGIDLPKEACRILVIDGLPDVRRKIDKIDQGVLIGSNRIINNIIQRIEQGMGRAVRSNDDYCVVFLMGRTLTSYLYAAGTIQKFTSATKEQIKLSEKISEQLYGKELKEIDDVIKYCLNRDPNWVRASKGILASLNYDQEGKIDPITVKLRKAFNLAMIRNYNQAAKELNEITNQTENLKIKGWLKQILSEYINFYNPVEAQKTLMSAANDNRRVLHPIDGIAYHRLLTIDYEQAQQCKDFLYSRYDDPNKLILEINGLIDQFIFKPDTASIFEEITKQLANFIGFKSQRPENEYKRGPDVLWGVGQLQYFIIECKNGSLSPTITKADCNQLNGSVNWFLEKYDRTCSFVPIMIHPSNVFEYAASPHEKIKIITKDKIEQLAIAIKNFVKSVAVDNKINDRDSIKELLTHYKLRPADIISNYMEPSKKINK